MKLQFINQDDLNFLKSNLHHHVKNYTLPTNEWIEKELGHNPFVDTKYEMPEITLDMSTEKTYMTDAKNVEEVYSKLKFLSESQASDERLWAGLCLGHFWNYTQYRWEFAKFCTESKIDQHYYFGFGARRSLTRNSLSRLWWIGRLTYDETRKDPFELTKFVCENADYIMHIIERNTSNNIEITRAFVSALIDARNDGLVVNTDVVGAVAKYLNLLGGTYILDCLPYETLYEKLYSKIKSM